MIQRPVEYIYLDHPGIESLHAQIVDSVETSRVRTTRRETGIQARVGVKLRNFLIRLLAGLDGDVSAELAGSKTHTEQLTTEPRIEHKLGHIVKFLGESGTGYFFTTLAEAIRQLGGAEGTAFINIQDTFNAPQFYGTGAGSDRVNADGCLLLEKGGAMDYDERDEYYKRSTAVVKVSASVKKLRAGGMMGATAHEAILFQGFHGRRIPLHIFGTIKSTSDYFQIKPFAIWK